MAGSPHIMHGTKEMKHEEHCSESILFDIVKISETGLHIDESMPGSWFSFESADFKIIDSLCISGSLKKVDKDILFEAIVKLGFNDRCARCIRFFDSAMVVRIKTIFSQATENREDICDETEGDDLDVSHYSGKHLDILPTVRDHVALEIPMKPLCSFECKGLCAQCGIVLNTSNCDCKTEVIDPRLEILKKLLPDSEL